jgi:hypothetical protein
MAQETSPELENHPTVKVVREYLTCMLEQNWSGSSALVEVKSLTDLRDDYIDRVKKSATLDEEKMVLEKFKVSRLEDIKKLSGAEFYIAYHRLLKERTPVEPAVLAIVRKTMKLRIIGVNMESDKVCHVLVRTKHNNDKVTVESLEVLSLVKQNDKWVVGLNEQTPRVTPLEAAKTGSTEEPKPEAKPEPKKEADPEPKSTKGTKVPSRKK